MDSQLVMFDASLAFGNCRDRQASTRILCIAELAGVRNECTGECPFEQPAL